MNIQFRFLLQRARKIYENRSIISLLSLITSFGIRYSKEKIGRYGFYNTNVYTNLLYWWNTKRGKYQVLADPFNLFEIDPDTIEYVTGRGPFPGKFMWQDIGLISDGGWDQSTIRVDELPRVRAIQERFGENKQWDQIQLEDIQASIQSSWRSSVEELYDSIQANGYEYQHEILPNCDSPQPFEPNKNYSGIERFQPCDEVVVDIGRDGEFLFVDGRHRLAIAKVIDIDKIPVRVSARHREWQQVRETIANTPIDDLPSSVEQHLDHPDVQDLLDKQ